MNKYSYEGPVMLFDKCIEHIWRASTCAVSEAKARQNLAYQYKRDTGRAPNAKILLPGKITLIS